MTQSFPELFYKLSNAINSFLRLATSPQPPSWRIILRGFILLCCIYILLLNSKMIKQSYFN